MTGTCGTIDAANPPARSATLGELLHGLADAGALRDVRVHGLTQDSRSVTPGDAFVALRSLGRGVAAAHGLRHAAQARAQGAVAILFEPGLFERGLAEPDRVESGLDPVSAEPAAVAPLTVELAPAAPASIRSALAEPAPVEPALADTALAGPHPAGAHPAPAGASAASPSAAAAPAEPARHAAGRRSASCAEETEHASSVDGPVAAAWNRAAGAFDAEAVRPDEPADGQAGPDMLAIPGLGRLLGTLADRFWGAPSARLAVVGVTGTNGKTTTVQLIGEALQRAGLAVGSIGTLGVGLHGALRPHAFTTPQVLDVHRHLAAMSAAGATHVAMEVSSHALDQGRVDGVRFDIAVFTNLTRDHLDYHGDMAAYGSAKATLFEWPGLRAAVINLDDAFGRALVGRLPPATRAITVSARAAGDAALRAEHVQPSPAGIGFDLVIGGARHAVRSPLLGRFNVDNLLATAGVLTALGWTPPAIAASLSQLPPVAGRMNRLGGDIAGQPALPLVVIDYAHTPDALQQALSNLRAHTRGTLVCVFGCGGERDQGKRPQMARIAERLADRVIVTDDNPRRENGDAIVAEILAGFQAPAAVQVQRDRALAIRAAIAAAAVDDVVLVAGKGHEPYQEIGGVRVDFDDTAVVREALEARACVR